MANIADLKLAIDQMQEESRKLKERANQLRVDFKKIMSDKSIPLDDRWDMFIKAPSDLKGHQSYVWDSKILGRDFNWYTDYSCERHQEVDLIEFVENLEEDFNAIAEGEDAAYMFTEKFEDTPEVVEALKEEILADNIASFTFDW
jgi:hypothetical protein